MSAPENEDPRSLVQQLFLQFLDQRKIGAESAFEELVQGHPHVAEELRRVRDDWVWLHDQLGVSNSLTDRIQAQFGAEVDPDVTLPHGDELVEDSADSHQLADGLSLKGDAFGRYEIRSELGRGGMGAVLRVWDRDLRRSLAMKVILGLESRRTAPRNGQKQQRLLARFLEEAQVTGQLDHPGIVPVHELGLDPEGRVYFTMKLVKGRTLREIFERVRKGEEGWTQTRALGLVQKVCEAMSYAHHKSVIHRDLKPDNIMIGRFGEVYVMDWGLAKILGREDERDIRIRAEDPPRGEELLSQRSDQGGHAPDSMLCTMDGDVIGTPAYMSPEQAASRVDEMGPQSDVYSVGAMIYHLLTGQMPYVLPGSRPTAYMVWRWVLDGPPRPVHELNHDVPPELEAICDKAMAREPRRRYADMGELAADLQAYLEHRVVSAYESGALAEFRKFVHRNKGIVAIVLIAVVVILGGALTSSAVLAGKNHDLRVARDEARGMAEKVFRLSAIQDLDGLVRRADGLWPIEPGLTDSYRAWLGDTEVLAADLGKYRQNLIELRRRALESTPEDALDPAQRAWRFADREDSWWHDQLQALVAAIEELRDPRVGIERGLSPLHGMGIAKRLELAQTVEALSITGEAVAAQWTTAIESIADEAACPAYLGLRVHPELGLVPIGRDPRSSLWEFADVRTGVVPLRDPSSGALAIDGESAVVFVLIPGGEFLMGAQRSDPSAPNHDPDARRDEVPVHGMRVSAFLLSKYELTQGQWRRLFGANPSFYCAPQEVAGHTIDDSHPVESVSWMDCERAARWMGMELPTEAQWEYAARGGTSTCWSSGNPRESLLGHANVADQVGALARKTWLEEVEWPELDDGHAVHAPVGSLLANPFGLHDMHGNVWEWCQDWYDGFYRPEQADGDLEPSGVAPGYHVIRGGAFYFPTSYARSARRYGNLPGFKLAFLGVRPARAL